MCNDQVDCFMCSSDVSTHIMNFHFIYFNYFQIKLSFILIGNKIFDQISLRMSEQNNNKYKYNLAHCLPSVFWKLHQLHLNIRIFACFNIWQECIVFMWILYRTVQRKDVPKSHVLCSSASDLVLAGFMVRHASYAYLKYCNRTKSYRK